MNKPERVLQVLEDNGFDWWGNVEFVYSTNAELATNRSALEAGVKAIGITTSGEKIRDNLQLNLIHDITWNNSEDYWSIWFNFLGLEE